MINKTDYSKLKAELIRGLSAGRDITEGLRILKLKAPNYCDEDADYEWMRSWMKTNGFTKPMSVKKAEKLISVAMYMMSVGNSDFSRSCEQKAAAYLEMCRNRSRKRKRAKIGVAVAFSLLLAIVIVGAWYGDRAGLFYGQRSLSFIADGAEIRQDNAVKYNNYVQLSIPAKKGYDVTGVVDIKTGTQLFDANGKSLNVVSNRDLSDYDDCVFEVTYAPHEYRMRVMSANNVASELTVYTVEDDPAEILDEPQYLEGYVFDGWFTDAKCRKPFTGNFADYTDSDAPLVLYPHYSLDGWTLTWQLNGGAFKADVLDMYTILSDVRLPDNYMVEKEGYELIGWSMNGKILEYFTPTIMKDVVLSAVWQPIRYKITYELNGGVLDGADTSYTIEDEFFLDRPVRDGYDFDGWYANRIFTKSAVAIEQGTTGDKTFYAKWSPVVYTITYALNGGENHPLNPTSYTADKPVKLQSPFRDGYIFQGWFMMGGEKVDELNATEYGSVYLIAMWKSNEYTITVNPNNGSKAYKQTVRYGEFYSIERPVKKGYTFADYYMNGEPIGSVGQYPFTYDISVVAQYKVNKYTISYISESKELSKQQVAFGEPYTLYNPPAKNYYEFVGWYDAEVGGARASDGVYNTEGNTVLYAYWIKVMNISLASNSEYTIDESIEKAYVTGNYTGENDLMTNVNIKISSRSYGLTLVLINAGFKAKNDCVAVDCDNSAFTLRIINRGTSHIEGGNGSRGSDGASGGSMTCDNRNGSNGLAGQYAVNCGTVVFEQAQKDSSLTLKSGNGGDGGDGGVDKDRSRMWLNYLPDGGNGGNSKAALYCTSYCINGTSVSFEVGSGGAKGKAGSRGDWWCAACYGSDGSSGSASTVSVRFK